jgi:hypothetical protein
VLLVRINKRFQRTESSWSRSGFGLLERSTCRATRVRQRRRRRCPARVTATLPTYLTGRDSPIGRPAHFLVIKFEERKKGFTYSTEAPYPSLTCLSLVAQRVRIAPWNRWTGTANHFTNPSPLHERDGLTTHGVHAKLMNERTNSSSLISLQGSGHYQSTSNTNPSSW